MAIDTLLLHQRALDFFNDLILTRNTNKKEAVTKMKNVLNDEETAFNVLIKLKDEKKKEDLLKPGKKAQEEDAVDKNFWKNP